MTDEVKAQPQYDGESLKIGSAVYVVPPLSFKLLKAFESEITSIENDLAAAIGARQNPLPIFRRQLPIILAAVNRNYPEMKLEELEEHLDLRQSRKVYQAVMGISDIDLAAARKTGGIPAPGKDAAAAATN